MPALVFLNLGFDLGPRKLVVFRCDRKELPHLTVSWNNPSGEIDIHLTPPAPRSADDRESVAKFQASALDDFFSSLGWEVFVAVKDYYLEVVWPVRPQWLRRNHYKLVRPKGVSVDEWLHRSAPKSRGKHRFDPQAFRNMPRHVLAQPTTRRLKELREQKQVWVVGTRGQYKGNALVLHYSTWRDGRPAWLAVDYDDATEFITRVRDLFSGRFEHLASAQWQRVYEALLLEEIGL